MSRSILRSASASERTGKDPYSPGDRAGQGLAAAPVPHGRIYLGRRDVRTPARAAETAHAAIVAWRSTEVRNALGQHFRASVQVEVRRPWWMPLAVYERLMRTVVVTSSAERRR